LSAPSLAPDARFEKIPEVVRRDIADETLLVPVRGGLARLQRIFVLNPVAAHVWELLDGSRDLAALERGIVERFEVSEEQARCDLHEFLGSLLEAALIRPAGAADPAAAARSERNSDP
jgi:hypothetical protein